MLNLHFTACIFTFSLAAQLSCVYALDAEIESNMADAVVQSEVPSIEIETFKQEVSRFYTTGEKLPSNEIFGVSVFGDGNLYAGTSRGLALYRDDVDSWRPIRDFPKTNVTALTRGKNTFYAAVNGMIWTSPSSNGENIPLPKGLEVNALAVVDDVLYLATTEGLFSVENHQLHRDPLLFQMLDMRVKVNDVAAGPNGTIAVAAEAGVFIKKPFQAWEALYPRDDSGRSWAPQAVQAVGFQPNGALWFASPQGVGVRDSNGQWTLFEGKDGLPFSDFTCINTSRDDEVWFGTTIGAIRLDTGTASGEYEWHYRQGKRWLPGDHVYDIAVTEKETWFATNNGVGVIEYKAMTLAEKAAHYEQQIEEYIKRTKFGYVSEVGLKNPEDFSEILYHDSDNDGLWTSMYGAGECFAYAALKDENAKKRAKEAFEALRFLRTVTQGGEVEHQPGFVARTVVPTSEPDPNKRFGHTVEGQKQKQQEDKLWKVITPRYVLNEEEGYWYKIDTSSDELDGHYFFYGLYYDLVAETEEEKARVREHVQAVTDHMLRNDFVLIDHDGEPTRWAMFRPSVLNRDFNWYVERGLNSLSMLSYLAVTEHITGDPKYGEIAKQLQEEHYYDINSMIAKVQWGPGSGNQSDDEMAFMNYYNLIKYSNDDELRNEIRYSLFNYWAIEYPEMNPLFNFIYAACCYGETYTDPWGTYDISPWEGWLEDSVDTLTGFSLDRRNWAHQNSHRIDLVPLPRHSIARYPNEQPGRLRAHRINGKVIPVENRHFNHWSTDAWVIDYGGNGTGLASGQVYLLPYYMGKYYGFIEE